MDLGQLALAMVTIMGTAVGLTEAFSPAIPTGWKPATSIVVGLVFGFVYTFIIPAAAQGAFLVILSGAVGTALVAVSKRVGGDTTANG